MSLALYDNAFVKKLKYISEKSNIHVYSVQDTRRLFEVIADENNDKPITLPIICLRRNDGYTLKEIGNTPRSANGPAIKSGESGKYKLNQIPIQIQYQIDVYARKFEEADAIMRELVFILTNSPNILVTVPYEGMDYPHMSALHLSPTIRDNSSVAERLIPGQFTRLTLDCDIPDAHLFDVRAEEFVKLSVFGLEVVSPDGITIVREPLPIATRDN